MKLSKIIDTATIVLLLLLVLSGFMIMKNTVESNSLNTDLLATQAKSRKNMLIQIGLMNAELRNLQKDIYHTRTELESIHQKLYQEQKIRKLNSL
jgi:5-bromo-4-chloroindolyl phosphate hydrolysis protein